jgi:regulator of sirC expression with transglutaminase-like and TPR domain
MSFSFAPPTALGYFATLTQDDDQFPLLEAAASIAQDEYPDLDVQQVLGEVDQLLARLRRRVSADASALQRLQQLNRFFYRDLGFAGNANHFHDPDNSLLNVVLRTRRGIPVSLAVLWLELAQGLKLKAHGVGFPGHFLVKVALPQGQVVVDPLTGQSLSREDLLERLEPFQQAQGLVGDFEVPLGLYLQPCPGRDTVARMLRNLKEIHRTAEDWPRMLAVQERLVVLLPDVADELRDRGLVRAELGRTHDAIDDLRAYVRQAPDAMDVNLIKDRLVELSQQAG